MPGRGAASAQTVDFDGSAELAALHAVKTNLETPQWFQNQLRMRLQAKVEGISQQRTASQAAADSSVPA